MVGNVGAGIRDVARRKHATVAEWFKAADLRSAHSLSGTGSNPVGGRRHVDTCIANWRWATGISEDAAEPGPRLHGDTLP